MTTVQNAPAQETNTDDVEEKSPLRIALESSVEQVENGVTDESTTPEVPETPAKGTKIEDPDGSTPAKDQQKSLDPTKDTKTQEKQGEEGADKAPASWKAPAKAKWATVDPEIKAEVARRERDFNREIQRQAPVKQFAEAFTGMVKPYMPRLQAAGAAPMQAIKSLLDVDQVLSSAPMGTRAKMMAKLITDYGIDVAALDEALSGGDPDQSNPTSILENRIQQAVAPLQQQLQQFTAREQQIIAQEAQRTEGEVEAFAANTEKYPHFEMLQAEMADIIEYKATRGVTLGLEEAYNLALRMNPEAQRLEAERTKVSTAQKQNELAKKALGASLSVTGAPAPLRTEVDPSDLRATIEAAMAAHGGR